MDTGVMDSGIDDWFAADKAHFADSYLAHPEPWKQSGFSGPRERWDACRRPIYDCLDRSGSFLDIGCANGYLMECMIQWNQKSDLVLDLFGLDCSPELVALATKRLPRLSDHLFCANALYWNPAQTFDFVRTELVYVPDHLQAAYVDRLLSEFVSDSGRLLVTEYRSRSHEGTIPWVDQVLTSMGFRVSHCTSGYWEGKELTRVAVIKKS